MNSCWAREAGWGCSCQPEDPPIASPGYAARRRHVDAGDLDALRQVIRWLRDGVPQLHIRYSDGEFMSLMGVSGKNCDGQDLRPFALGIELRDTLFDMAEQGVACGFVGGDWLRPHETFGWLEQAGLLDALPWCPSQVFVNGIASGETMRLLETLWLLIPGRKWIVGNPGVVHVVGNSPLRALQVPVAAKGSYDDMPEIERTLARNLKPGDVVLWAAGLGCKPAMWRLYDRCPGTTHLDVGCLFDLAAGIVSRGWMRQPPDDARLRPYRDQIIPWLRTAP